MNESNYLFPDETMAELTVPKMMFRRIQKRDGTLVDFDKKKITNAIYAAAQAVGGKDYELADSLADRVILYLARTFEDGLLNVEQVQDAIEKVLIENGHARTVKAFILYRAQRQKVRALKSVKQQHSSDLESDSVKTVHPTDLHVRTTDAEVIAWNRQRIIDALVRETELDTAIASQISREVEEQIIYSKIQIITAGLIRELVNAKLIEYGFEKEQRMHTRLGIPLYDFEQLLFPLHPAQVQEAGKSSPSVEQTVTGSIYRQYALAKVFSVDVIDAHTKGDIYLHHLDEITKVYQLRISADTSDIVEKTFDLQNLISKSRIYLNWNQKELSPIFHNLLTNKPTSAQKQVRVDWVIVLSEEALADPELHKLWDVTKQNSILIQFERESSPRRTEPILVIHKISLNLPRLGYLAERNETKLMQLFNTRLRLIAQAHLQKQELMNRIPAFAGMTLPLRKQGENSKSILDLKMKPVFSIGIMGLNEFVQTYCGNQLHQSRKLSGLAFKLLSALRDLCMQLSQTMNIPIVLEPSYDPEISYRFAKSDLERYSTFASQVVKKKPTNGGVYYTLGANLSDDTNIDLLTRIDQESRFHPYLNEQAYVTVSLPDTKVDKFITFLKQVFYKTDCQSILLKP